MELNFNKIENQTLLNQQKDKKESLIKEGGFIYETRLNEEGVEKNHLNILGVEIETYASKEDIEKIKSEILLSRLDQKMLREIVDSYKLNQPILFEGDPGAGKTFLYEKFIEMIYGKDCAIDTLVGSPRTSELDILGHWAPKESSVEYDSVMQKYQDSDIPNNISEGINDQIEALNSKLNTNEISQDDFLADLDSLTKKYQEIQKKTIFKFMEDSGVKLGDSDWEFKQGALLRAYSGRDGKGYPLIIDEFNLIPSNYQQIFLQISGQNGGLSNQVSFSGNGDKTIFKRGPETALFFASNFPEKTSGRSEVVPPMSDRLIWNVLSNEEYKDKKRAIKQTAGGRLSKRKKESFGMESSSIEIPIEKGIQWDKVLDEELGEQIADIVDILDEQFVAQYEAVGDKILVNEDKRERVQKLEFSGRNSLRLFNYLDKFQFINEETGEIDFTKTLKNGYEKYYVNRIYDEKLRNKSLKIFDELMEGETGQIPFHIEDNRTLLEKIQLINKGEPLNNSQEIGLETRKQILELLVKKINKEIKVEEKLGNIKHIESKENEYFLNTFSEFSSIFSDEILKEIPTDFEFRDEIIDILSQFQMIKSQEEITDKNILTTDSISYLKKVAKINAEFDEIMYIGDGQDFEKIENLKQKYNLEMINYKSVDYNKISELLSKIRYKFLTSSQKNILINLDKSPREFKDFHNVMNQRNSKEEGSYDSLNNFNIKDYENHYIWLLSNPEFYENPEKAINEINNLIQYPENILTKDAYKSINLINSVESTLNQIDDNQLNVLKDEFDSFSNKSNNLIEKKIILGSIHDLSKLSNQTDYKEVGLILQSLNKEEKKMLEQDYPDLEYITLETFNNIIIKGLNISDFEKDVYSKINNLNTSLLFDRISSLKETDESNKNIIGLLDPGDVTSKHTISQIENSLDKKESFLKNEKMVFVETDFGKWLNKKNPKGPLIANPESFINLLNTIKNLTKDPNVFVVNYGFLDLKGISDEYVFGEKNEVLGEKVDLTQEMVDKMKEVVDLPNFINLQLPFTVEDLEKEIAPLVLNKKT